ncbi:MAG: hypothetical protein ABJU46_05155 [Paracoccaceae bacterium]
MADIHAPRSIGEFGLFDDIRCGRQHRLITLRKPLSAMRDFSDIPCTCANDGFRFPAAKTNAADRVICY